MGERARRLWAGTEAGAIGWGGVAAVAHATGMAISTVRKERDEARAGARPEEVAHPEVWPALEKLVDPITRRDPESPLRWTCKSTHPLSAELFAQHGIQVSHKTVAKLLRDHGYTACRRRTSPSTVTSTRTATLSLSTSTADEPGKRRGEDSGAERKNRAENAKTCSMCFMRSEEWRRTRTVGRGRAGAPADAVAMTLA
jgi:hypothetical protein